MLSVLVHEPDPVLDHAAIGPKIPDDRHSYVSIIAKKGRLCKVKYRFSHPNTSSTMRLRNWITFLSLPLVGASVLFATTNPQRCEHPISTSDLAILEEIAFDTMAERPTELSFLGLESDASDLVLLSTRSSSRELPEDQTIDHPMDRATLFLYADINGYSYMFSFDDCGQILNIANRSGFRKKTND